MFNKILSAISLVALSPLAQAWVSVGSSPGFGTCNYTTIQAAIVSGDNEIRVLNNQTFTENIVISGSIDIKGGYTSCLQASLDNALGPNTEIDGSGLLGSPTVTINSTDEPTIRLYNLEISGARDTTLISNGGHGIDIDGSNGNIQIYNSLITDNTAEDGGGIYMGNPPGTLSLLIQDSLVFGNTSSVRGGGIFCANGNTSVRVSGDSLIGENNAEDGGGIYAVNGCSVTVDSGSSLTPGSGNRGVNGNTASRFGAGIYLDLAASLYLEGSVYALGILGNRTDPVTVANNLAQDDGGAIYAKNSSIIEIKDALISNNYSFGGNGGAIYLGESITTPVSLTIQTSDDVCWRPGQCSIISGNESGNYGGAIYMQGASELQLQNSHISGNSADFGTAIYVSATGGSNTSAMLEGNYIYENGSNGSGSTTDNFAIRGNGDVDITILHNTIVDNDLNDARAVIGLSNSNLTMKNSIIHNGTETVLETSGTATTDVSCLIANENSSIQAFIWNPDFIDSANDDYHLGPNSEAIDACPSVAAHSIDTDLENRGWDDETITDFGGPFDVGADESYINDIIFKNGFE